MSKSKSSLFHTTKSNARMLDILAKIAIKRLIRNTPGGSTKSMACAAYDIVTGEVVAAFAGEPPDINNIHPTLQALANDIGGIGSHGLTERNRVGVCAEFQVVNQLLMRGSSFSNIRLTEAIRPRTGEVRPYCANCQKMFSKLIK